MSPGPEFFILACQQIILITQDGWQIHMDIGNLE